MDGYACKIETFNTDVVILIQYFWVIGSFYVEQNWQNWLQFDRDFFSHTVWRIREFS